jgi:hypothetical protein
MVTFIVLIINYEFWKLKYVFAMEEMLKCMRRYCHLVPNPMAMLGHFTGPCTNTKRICEKPIPRSFAPRERSEVRAPHVRVRGLHTFFWKSILRLSARFAGGSRFPRAWIPHVSPLFFQFSFFSIFFIQQILFCTSYKYNSSFTEKVLHTTC